jgi:hypothetical protein
MALRFTSRKDTASVCSTSSSDGDVRLIGTVADGTKIQRAVGSIATADFTFHTPLYGNAGFLSGTLTFRDRPARK